MKWVMKAEEMWVEGSGHKLDGGEIDGPSPNSLRITAMR
jgi:hypothetical protein